MIAGAVTYTGARWIGVGIALAVMGGAVALVAASAAAGRAKGETRPAAPLAFLVGADGRVSTSRTVALAWTVVVVYILAALIVVNPASWSAALHNLSPTYLVLLGFPYASLIVAKATVASRVARGTLVKPQADQASLADLVADDDGTPDVFDVQYVAFNLVAIVFVIVASWRADLSTGFPAIPHGLLLLTGAPSSVYVANKFMPGAGPVISGVVPRELRVGQTFTVIGRNLAPAGGSETEPPTVRVGAVEAPPVTSSAPTGVTVAAPDLATDLGRPVDVSLTTPDGQTVVSSGALRVLGPIPRLDGIDRGTAQVGEEATLRGGWSEAQAARATVLLDASVAAPVSRRRAGTLTFVVPRLADLDPPRQVPVTIKLGDETSQPVALVVAPATPSAGNGARPARSGIEVAL